MAEPYYITTAISYPNGAPLDLIYFHCCILGRFNNSLMRRHRQIAGRIWSEEMHGTARHSNLFTKRVKQPGGYKKPRKLRRFLERELN